MRPLMNARAGALGTLMLALLGSPAAGHQQEEGVRARLAAAGAPEAFVNQVGGIVDSARGEGLPTEPLEAKAMEGWAKRHRVSTQNVVRVMEQMRLRLREAHQICTRTGYENPPGNMVAAGAEALDRGLQREQVQELIRSGQNAEAAAAGLTVAAALAAQGLEASAAVHAVREQHRRGGPPEQIFELPSAVADLMGRGMAMQDVARQIMQGGGLPMPGGMGPGPGAGRPQAVPPAMGPGSTDPPGQGGRRRGG